MISSDTPPDVKQLQLKIWLSKPPAERLRIFMDDNDAMMRMCRNAKKIEHQNENNTTKP